MQNELTTDPKKPFGAVRASTPTGCPGGARTSLADCKGRVALKPKGMWCQGQVASSQVK
jgi:hypothetical protein